MVKEIKISDFDYPLPDERIARHPLAERDSCKLIVARPDGSISHSHFADLPDLIPSDALLVFNDTRVINARITFHKTTGAAIEVFLLEPIAPHDYVLMFQARSECRWKCIVGNLKRWKEGSLTLPLEIDGVAVNLTATRLQHLDGNAHEVEFRWDNPDIPFSRIVDAAGYIPIPPYLKRDAEASDMDDYQTVFSRFKGSVAAPTAGLHFTDSLLSRLRSGGVTTAAVTLHVGAGTFLPVKSETIGEHPMHTEVFSVTRTLIESVMAALREGRQIVAVGTTTVRTLESLPLLGMHIAAGDPSMKVGQWEAYSIEDFDTLSALQSILDYLETNRLDSLTASTAIMIAPGFRWRIVERLVTNFHQPQSTLLLLVSSFLQRHPGAPAWRAIYDEALAKGYRFLSYGDACLFG